MKLLIAAEGDSPDSRVARRFGSATWYFLFDTDTFSWTAMRRSREQGTVLQWGYEAGVKAVVVGHPGPQLLASCRAFGFTCARARSISVRDAAERYARGELHTVPVPQTGLAVAGWFPWRPFASMNIPRLAVPRWWNPVTPRGRHHVQQLAGRGH